MPKLNRATRARAARLKTAKNRISKPKSAGFKGLNAEGETPEQAKLRRSQQDSYNAASQKKYGKYEGEQTRVGRSYGNKVWDVGGGEGATKGKYTQSIINSYDNKSDKAWRDYVNRTESSVPLEEKQRPNYAVRGGIVGARMSTAQLSSKIPKQGRIGYTKEDTGSPVIFRRVGGKVYGRDVFGPGSTSYRPLSQAELDSNADDAREGMPGGGGRKTAAKLTAARRRRGRR